MSWLVNISEKLSDVAHQISSNQSSDNEFSSNISLIVSLKKEVENLKADKSQLEQSIAELDQQHEEHLQQLLKSKEELVHQNQSLQQTILELKTGKNVSVVEGIGAFNTTLTNQEILKDSVEKLGLENNELKKLNLDLSLKLDAANNNADSLDELQRENLDLKNENLQIKEKLNVLSNITTDYKLSVVSNDDLLLRYNLLKESNIQLNEKINEFTMQNLHKTETDLKINDLINEIKILRDCNLKLKDDSKPVGKTDKIDSLSETDVEFNKNVISADNSENKLHEGVGHSSLESDIIKVLENLIVGLRDGNNMLLESRVNTVAANKLLKFEERIKSFEIFKVENISLHKTIIDLNEQIILLNNNVIESANQIDRLKNSNFNLEKNILEMEDDKNILLKKIEHVESLNSQMIQENKVFQAFISDLEEKQKDHDNISNIVELRKSNSDLMEQNNILKNKNAEFLESNAVLINQVSQLHRSNDELNKIHNNIQKTHEQLFAKHHNLQKSHEELVENYNNLQESNKELIKNFNYIQNTNDELFINYNNLQKTNDQLLTDYNLSLKVNEELKINNTTMLNSLSVQSNIRENTGIPNALGKTDSEKVLENKVEELLTSLQLAQEKLEQQQRENKLLLLNSDNNVQQKQDTHIGDENMHLQRIVGEQKDCIDHLELSLHSVNQQYDLKISDLKRDYEQELNNLNLQIADSSNELKKLQAEKRHLESRINSLTNDYTSVLEKLSKNNLENKDIICKTFAANESLLKLFEKLSIQKPLLTENSSIQLVFEENAKILFDFIERNFKELEKLRSVETERNNLRELLQKTTADYSFSNDKLEDASKQLFVLQQKLSCSRSDILTATDLHKKQLAEHQAKHETEKEGLRTAINELSAKNVELLNQLDSYKTDFNQKHDEKNLLIGRLNECIEKYERVIEEKSLLERRVEDLKESLTRYENEDQFRVKAEENSLNEINDKLNKALKENNRLKKHLAEMEESQMKEIMDLTSREIQLLDKIKDLETLLSAYNDQTKNSDDNKSRICAQLEVELKMARTDLEVANRKCADQQKLIADYKISTSNLQNVLEGFQQNSTSAEIVELEKTKKLLSLAKTLKEELSHKCSQQEIEISGLRENEMKYLKQINDSRSEQNELCKLKQTVLVKDELITSLESRLSAIKVDKESKIDKLVIKNLLLGYLHAPSTKKEEVLNVVGHILDFSAEDFVFMNSKDSTRWIDRVLFSNDNSKNQSFMELFVKFLEKESSPPRQILMSTEPFKSHSLSRSNSNQSQQDVINSDQSDRAGTAALSRYLASLQQQRASSRLEKTEVVEDVDEQSNDPIENSQAAL